MIVHYNLPSFSTSHFLTTKTEKVFQAVDGNFVKFTEIITYLETCSV